MRQFAAATCVMCVACSGGASGAEVSMPIAACAPGAASSAHAVAAPARPGDAAASTASPAIDPVEFFQRLVARYRGLYLYRDVATITHITRRDGRESNRVQTQITCEVADGKLTVTTPASQARKGLGVDLPVRQSQPTAEAKRNYDLWLAPHMALKFTDEPLKKLRAGVDEEFTATEAESVTIDNKPMVHVELRSGCARDGASERCAAKVDLYVNPDSMLVERIDTQQQLPDGADYSTSMQITPEEVEGETPPDSDAPVPPAPISQPMPPPA